jgi:hypothetical protein
VFQGADIGFVGNAYSAPMPLQDAQTCINWFVEVDQNKNAKMPVALLGSPGLAPIQQLGTSPVRGAWVLPGLQSCLFVSGITVWLLSIQAPATASSQAVLRLQGIGNLLTNSGRVVIRDNGPLFNGLGGYAVLVDGLYGYFYRLSGAGFVTFTGNLTSASNTITFPVGQLVPYTLIVGSGTVLTDSGSGLPASTTITAVSYTANTITLNNAASAGVSADNFTFTIPTFGQITDPAFLGASRVAFIEGWLIFNQPGTRTFYTTAPIPYTLTFAGAFYALKDSTSDNLATLIENNRELLLLGDTHSEYWYNAGGASFAFQRLPGIGPRIGCSAPQSISPVGAEIAWLARIGEQGENVVAMTNQYDWQRISTHAVEHAISQYATISDAIGDTYEEEGHIFYVLTFPTADVTWVYDLTSSLRLQQPCWHQRLSFDPTTGLYHRHRANCYVNFAGMRVCGDYQNGLVYNQSRSFYSDNGAPLRAQRRTPHVWSKENRKRVFQSRLQIEFNPGVGLQSGQGQNPQAMLRWSDNGGFTWSNEHWTTIGAAGKYRNRAVWRRLGQAWDRVWEVNVSDPVNRDIIGCTLFGEAEEEEAA